MRKPWQAMVASVPLLTTPLLVYVLAEGAWDFGGGEKDVLLALPWLLWSVVFAASAWVLIMRGWNPARWVGRSILLATALLAALAVLAYVTSSLGVAGLR